MEIAILCSSNEHPVWPWLESWARETQSGHSVSLVPHSSQLPACGDILFLVSCGEIIGADIRSRFGATLVLHASDLPKGRGMSPHIWAVLEGAEQLTVSLIEAEDKLDTGDIWAKRQVRLDGAELYDEINAKVFAAEVALMSFAVDHFDDVEPRAQDPAAEPTYYRKRTPADSEIDPQRPIAEQFDLLRVCDSERFPAFFYHRGATYRIKLEKLEDE